MVLVSSGVKIAEESINVQLEGARLSRKHIKIMLISGMSFFTDAYDLFIIGIVLLMITPIFHLTALQIGITASAALFGAVIGPLLFGFIGDKFGRKYSYWITVTLLIIAALGSSTAISYIQLIAWRFLLGIAIGGDYPLSATIVAEYANKDDRGKLIASTFAMQGFGIIAGIAIAFILVYSHVPIGIAWRILLAAGAIPSITILYARTKLMETPLYSMSKGKLADAKKALVSVAGNRIPQFAAKSPAVKNSEEFGDAHMQKKISFKEFARKRWKIMLGTSLSWFLLDISYYGTTIFTPYLTTFFGFNGLLSSTTTTALILLFAAVPGYWIAVALIDKQGRKSMQAIGFLIMGIAFVTLFFFGAKILAFSDVLFFFIYGLTFLFTNYGPNTTTYVYPVELYPTQLRARGHGLAATSGKFGAALSTLFFPLIIVSIGKYGLIGLLGIVAIMGFIVTVTLLPETKKKPLSETSGEYELLLVTSTLSEDFRKLMQNISSGMQNLNKLFSDTGKRKEYFKKIKSEEHAADTHVHSIMDYLATSPTIKFGYRDVSHLASRLDDIMDSEEAVAARMDIYKITKVENDMRKLLKATEQCINQIIESVNVLERLQYDKSTFPEIEKLRIKASKYENDADEILRSSLSRLMQSHDTKYIIKYKEIYEHLESISDRCIDALDVVGDIALRYIHGIES